MRNAWRWIGKGLLRGHRRGRTRRKRKKSPNAGAQYGEGNSVSGLVGGGRGKDRAGIVSSHREILDEEAKGMCEIGTETGREGLYGY